MFSKSNFKKSKLTKYIYLLFWLFGLCNTMANTSLLNNIETQELDDTSLIKKVQAEIDEEVFEFGSLNDAYMNSPSVKEFYNPDQIPSKESYFKAQLFTIMFYDDINDQLVLASKENPPKRIGPKFLLPSSSNYQNFINRKKAFQILDSNLKISISAYSNEVVLLNSPEEYPETYTPIKVKDAADLTGDEIRKLNGIMNDISKNNKVENIVITDGTYNFHVYQKEFIRIEEYEKLDVSKGSIVRKEGTIMYGVADVQNLTTKEIVKRDELVVEIVNSTTFKTLVITDGQMKTIINNKNIRQH